MFNGKNEKRKGENEFLKMWIEDRIVIIKYKPNIKLDISTSRLIVPDRLRFQGGKAYPILCMADGVTDFPPSAQDFMAKEGSALITAISFFCTTLVAWTHLNFYAKVYSKQIPTHVACTEREARSFLTAYL